MAVMKEIPEPMGHIASGDQERIELETCQSDGGECHGTGQLGEVRAWPAVPRAKPELVTVPSEENKG